MMELKILHGNSVYSATVELTETVLQVKTKIELQVKAQALRLRFTCNGKLLVNSSTVGENGLYDGCIIHCATDAEMTIFINEVDGNPIPVMMESFTTGLKMKHELLANQGKYFINKGSKEMKDYQQKLYHGGVEIKHSMTLSEQGVFAESIVDILFMRQSKMTLTVDSYTGQQIVLANLSSDINVWKIKKMLSNQCGIQVDKQILVFKGRLLEHGANLPTSSYKLYDGAKLNLLQGLKHGIIKVTIIVVPLQVTIELQVDRSNKIGELKTLIEGLLSGQGEEIPKDVQVLYFTLSRFEDNEKTLADYYITNGSVINLVYSKMRISVKLLDGYVSKMWVVGSTCIHDLKTLIYEKEGFHPSTQKLSMDGRMLHDKNTIDWYKIRSDFTLDLTLVTSS